MLYQCAGVGFNNPQAFYPPTGAVAGVGGQIFFSANYGVDTFLFISGFLVPWVWQSDK